MGTKSLVEANDTYWLSIMLAGAEQVQPLIGQSAVVATAGWCLLMAQGADCDGEGALSEGAVLIVVFTEALAVFAELLDAFQGGMDHIVDLRAVPVLQFASHVGHEAVTVSVETLRVVNHGVVNMQGSEVLDGRLHCDACHQSWPQDKLEDKEPGHIWCHAFCWQS